MKRALLVTALIQIVAAVVWAQHVQQTPCDPGNGGLTLPSGFCASVVADNLGAARHMAVSPQGDLYVMLRRAPEKAPPGSVLAFRDADGDGTFEQQARFGPGLNGTAIAWHDDYLYVGADTKLVRFRMANRQLVPTGEPETIVEFPEQRAHTAKPFAFGRNGEVYVHVGAPSNACQDPDRRAELPGQSPCPLLAEHGGIWKYDASRTGQRHSAANRFATGIRHTTSLMAHPVTGVLYQVQHGRDQLDTMWPKRYTARQNGDLPAEEMHLVREGSNFGWPYCFFDLAQQKRIQNPEYGGDGESDGSCAQYDTPITTFPAHNAPLDLMFYTGTQFPAEYRGGAFVAFHGSWNRAPLPMDGYNIRFVPFKGDRPSGPHRVFASGFTGKTPIMGPNEAMYRPTGLAQAPDGSVYVSEDAKGRVWKISYVGPRGGTGE